MDYPLTGNAKVSGSGTIPGGRFDQVKIAGSGRIDGDVEANSLSIAGSATAKGNININDISIHGSSHFEKDLRSEAISVAGSAKVDGSIQASKLSISGSFHCGNSIKGDTLTLRGYMKVAQDVEVEEFDANGGFSISGLLNAEQVKIKMDGTCVVKEIGGEKIHVSQRLSSKLTSWLLNIFSRFSKKKYNKMRAEIIEGDEIYLEHSHVGTVRGSNVTIGPNCVIDQVEYSDSIHVDPNAKVKNKRRL
ncbi:MAG TPA: polymer-forming cytoskeletal protein [Bacillaceae bacterium]|nr:polymer-forming cytoskeletal protein [Paenibacillus bovis]HLU23138.1 polymer-forming cytoskeletal protein [Bacillaceae bacterium]